MVAVLILARVQFTGTICIVDEVAFVARVTFTVVRLFANLAVRYLASRLFTVKTGFVPFEPSGTLFTLAGFVLGKGVVSFAYVALRWSEYVAKAAVRVFTGCVYTGVVYR